MKSLFAAALLAVPFSLWSQATAPAPTERAEPMLTEQQVASISKQLEALEKQISASRGSTFGTALADFKAGMASDKDARDLYLKCYKRNHFDLKDSKEADFKDWKDRNDLKHKDPEFLAGIRFQLEFLVLTLQAQDAKDVGNLIPALKEFMKKELVAVEANYKHNTAGQVQVVDKTAKAAVKPGTNGKMVRTGGGNSELVQILRQSVKGSEFVKAFMLEEYLRLKEWEYQPFDFVGIYSNVILPYYRAKKPAELSAQWDESINYEFTLEKTMHSETEYKVFYNERFPERQWSKSSDLLESRIEPIKALADMLKTVRDNPTHPRAAEWLSTLREYVNQYQPPATPSLPAETPPPAAPVAK
jgi:hypothetical protein